MESLPTPVTTDNLNALLATIEKLPSAKVKRHHDIVTVTATRKSTGHTVRVLSAATVNGKDWHVMAVPSLLTMC